MIEFVKRLNCPSCGGADTTAVWSGRFSDPAVRSMLDRFFYSADLDGALGDQSFSLVDCSACGFRFHSHVIPDEWVPTVYGEWISREQIASFEEAHGYRSATVFDEKLASVRFLMRIRRLALAAAFNADELSLLDFGCGDGKLIALARSLGITAYGVDVSASRMQAAGSHGCPLFSTLDELLDTVKGPFHMVILNQVLEHVKDPDQVLKSLSKSMAKGSVLFVGVPNCQGIAQPRNFEEFHCVQPIEHINCFTPSSLKHFVETRGFAQVPKPFSVVTTSAIAAVKSLAGIAVRASSTDQFFRRTIPS